MASPDAVKAMVMAVGKKPEGAEDVSTPTDLEMAVDDLHDAFTAEKWDARRAALAMKHCWALCDDDSDEGEEDGG